MPGTVPTWQFTNAVDASRAKRLFELSEFSKVVALVAKAHVTDFAWEPFANVSLAGCNRASFLLKVTPETYDAFFNSPVGYRAQFAKSPAEGEAANRNLLNTLAPMLLTFSATRQLAPQREVAASLRAGEAKIWILESEVESQMGDECPAIQYAPWIEASESGVGLLAPVGTLLEVKGGWLDRAGKERRNPAKTSRSRDIFEAGYS